MEMLGRVRAKYGTAVIFAIIFLLFNVYIRFYQASDALQFIIGLIIRAGEFHPILIFNVLGLDVVCKGFLFLYSLFSLFLFVKFRDDAKKHFLFFLLTYGVLDLATLLLFKGYPNGIGAFLGAVILFIIFNKTLRGDRIFY